MYYLSSLANGPFSGPLVFNERVRGSGFGGGAGFASGFGAEAAGAGAAGLGPDHGELIQILPHISAKVGSLPVEEASLRSHEFRRPR